MHNIEKFFYRSHIVEIIKFSLHFSYYLWCYIKLRLYHFSFPPPFFLFKVLIWMFNTEGRISPYFTHSCILATDPLKISSLSVNNWMIVQSFSRTSQCTSTQWCTIFVVFCWIFLTEGLGVGSSKGELKVWDCSSLLLKYCCTINWEGRETSKYLCQ